MNLFVPFLMLTVPGIIAVSAHDGQLIHVTRKNWQTLMWKYLIYSFVIIFVANFIMFLSYAQRTVSYSPWATQTDSHVLMSSFVVKYSFVAAVAAFGLPRLWNVVKNLRNAGKKRKPFKNPNNE